MHEFDLYLDLVRRQLGVGRRRAEGICAELRSHLEAQAREFEQAGLSPEQAAAQAIARFGEPRGIAARLVDANGQHKREEWLRAAWVGLVVGGAIFYAFAVALYLAHVQSRHGVTTYWYHNVIMGGAVGLLSALDALRPRSQVRAVARVIAVSTAVLWGGFVAVMYTMSGYRGLGDLLKDVVVMGGLLVLVLVTIVFASAHAVNHWVLSPPAAEEHSQ
jgi:hypothetical protein